jgi:opacity protein-like surface antigen
MARVLLTAMLAAVLASAIPASAQQVTPLAGEQEPPRPPRLFFYVGLGEQLTTRTFSNSATFRVNAEDARFDSTYTEGSDLFFKANGGYLFSDHFGVGAGVTRFSTSTDAEVAASIPHPFFFRRPRTIQGTATGVERQERSVDLHLLATTTLGERLQLTIFGGPSFFRVQQDLATAVTYTEVYPYDEAAFEGTTTISAKESMTGFNVGGNVVFPLTERLGVGGDVQFSRAAADLSDGSATRVKVDAGGVQVTAGVRVAF